MRGKRETKNSLPCLIAYVVVVRRKKLLTTLRKRLIDVSVEEKFWELSKQGKSPVCLFAKRKSCEEVNKEC